MEGVRERVALLIETFCCKGTVRNLNGCGMVWLKIKREVTQVLSMFPLTRVPFGYRFVEPQPNQIRRRVR